MIKDFYQKNKAEIWLVILVLYVISLGIATISEVFDLGWCNWL